MRKYFSLASLFSMLLLVCCSSSVNGNIPNFSIGEELSKPADEKPIILYGTALKNCPILIW